MSDISKGPTFIPYTVLYDRAMLLNEEMFVTIGHIYMAYTFITLCYI